MTDQSNSVQPGPAEPRPNFPSTFGGLGLPQRSVGLKLLLVCGLALLLAIPSLFIYGVVLERSNGAEVAFNAVSEKVGGRQSVLGPVIGVPYAFAPDPEKPDKLDYSLGIVYPESGQADVDVQLEERQRGIHTVPVYTADISLDAEFHADNILNALPPGATPIWRDARVYFGVSDRRGIREPFKAAIDGAELDIEPANQRQYATGQYDPVPQANVSLASATIDGLELLSGEFRITANMVVSGADRFAVGPFAKDTEVVLRSNWSAPSFTGGVLPSQHDVGESDEGFSARWSMPYLARGIPGAGPNLNLNAVLDRNRDMAVRFIKPGNPYQSVSRALKYAVMFVGFVFLAYFLFEVTSSARAHPAQYVLVGLAQSIFYLLLLALSEQIGFDASFLIAASMTIGLIAFYSSIVFRSRQYGMRALGVLTGIYGLIYILMRADDYALLAGAFASFAAIGLTMWMTRHVDWYGGRIEATAQ